MKKREQNLIKLVEKYQTLILDVEKFIWEHPESGYREWQTSKYLADIFTRLGYELVKPQDIPGFYTDIETGNPGPKVLIMCEMDALICENHPESVNGYVHACGHHAQCAAVVGLAAVLKSEKVLEGLCGSIRLMAVPAEELIELDYRESLRQKRIIKYYGGKVEFMDRGFMDEVDLAFMIHTNHDNKFDFSCNYGGNGCLTKFIKYKGLAAHAGAWPDLGINALYAANIGIGAINAIRETFNEEDHIRVHPIILKGGESVNIIPSEVTVESYVRGSSLKCIEETDKKVNRALAAGAIAVGAKLTISDRPGYSPLYNDKNFMAVAKTCMEKLVGSERVNFKQTWSSGCTDMGDISCVMPAIHPYVAGAIGNAHSENYFIEDKYRACVLSAQAQILILTTLLQNNAVYASAIIDQSHPEFSSIREYLNAMDKFFMDKEVVLYKDNREIIIKI